MDTTFVNIDKLSFGYKSKTPIFQNFSLSFPTGQIIGLLGKNGTGKSTLFYLISGLLRPKAGLITYKGTDTKKRFPKRLRTSVLCRKNFSSLTLNSRSSSV